MTTPIDLLCPAKLNLALRVTGKREDGYHDLETVFQRVTLFDRLRVSRKDSPGVELSCPDSGLPVDGNNIVLKAAEAATRQRRWQALTGFSGGPAHWNS